MMPRLDGLSVVETLRERGLTVPVIMLTALSMASDKVDGLEAGADDYVVKPVAAEELNARINAVLRGRRWTVGESDTIRAGDIVVSPTSFRAASGPADRARQSGTQAADRTGAACRRGADPRDADRACLGL